MYFEKCDRRQLRKQFWISLSILIISGIACWWWLWRTEIVMNHASHHSLTTASYIFVNIPIGLVMLTSMTWNILRKPLQSSISPRITIVQSNTMATWFAQWSFYICYTVNNGHPQNQVRALDRRHAPFGERSRLARKGIRPAPDHRRRTERALARARVESYKNYLYFIYYFPVYDATDATSVRSEIDFVVTKNAVVTVHYEPLDEVFKEFKFGDGPAGRGGASAAGADPKNSLELMHDIIQHLISFEERQLRHIREKVEAVSKEIFKGQETQVLERITHLKRDISEYRISVRLQEPILKSLLVKGVAFWGGGSDAEVYLSDLIGEQWPL